MLEVDGRPLMERVIDQLQAAGIRRVSVTTHYKPEVISEHFGNGNGKGVEISYIYEEEPLGTAGALGMMDSPKEPVLVMNGDVLMELNLRAMIDFHRDHCADMTVAVQRYELQVPYGVVETRGIEVSGLAEKPALDFFINAGIYLLEPAAFEYIPARERFNMTDLIGRMVEAKCRVVSFPLVEYWLDIGEPDDYEQAQKNPDDRRSVSWIGAKSECW
jgi:NDP-sugar pyrophosphorylase family protein